MDARKAIFLQLNMYLSLWVAIFFFKWTSAQRLERGYKGNLKFFCSKKVQVFSWQLVLGRLPTLAIYLEEECCWMERARIVCGVRGLAKWRITCFVDVIFLKKFGIRFLSGLEHLWFYRVMLFLSLTISPPPLWLKSPGKG